MAKKDKKKDAAEAPQDQDQQDEALLATTELEPEPEEIQFTDTSYTSASFESLPPVEEPPKEKKKKGAKAKKSGVVVEAAEKASELDQWSDESLPAEEEHQVIEEERPKQKKKGKKKKDVEEIPNFEKPSNWKQMPKKDRDAWMVKRIEQWRADMEAEKQALLAGAKEKRLVLARERAELMENDNYEQEVRKDILLKTVKLLHRFEKQKKDYANNKQMQAEWQQYLRCDGLPDPRVVTQMNTYLHLWQMKITSDDDELERRCEEALPMLEMLEEFVSNSRLYTKLQAESFNEVRLALRAQLSATIQMASYHLLRNLEKNLHVESTTLSTYQREFKGLRLNLWVAVRMPTRKPRPVEPEKKPVELSFPSMKVAVKLPTIIDGSCVCVRAARSLLDLLSESSRSYALVADMPDRYEDLFVFNVKEHIATYKLNAEQENTRVVFFKDIKEKITALEKFLKSNPYTKNEKEKLELDDLNLSEPPFMPDPRTFIGESNELKFQKYLKACLTRTRSGEVNLRKYRISGGVLHLDLLVTPPQPKVLNYEAAITTFQLPKTLQAMMYQVQYRAPIPPPAGVTRTPEEIEAEMKRIEREYEKLALVTIDLPQDLMWSEPPIVCQWQEARKLWTSNYINDYKYNEDKLSVQFRTGVLWPIGIAALRYGNMPYQSWDMKPDPKGKGVLITVVGVAVTVTWLVLGSFVQLKSIANATTPALKEHFDKRYTVKRMCQIMREAACDFFPEFDGHSHVEGSCPKEWVLERHNYHVMAFLSRSYNFQWSRWNAQAGWRNIIMQLREAVDKKREAKFQLLLTTPQRAVILKDIEMTPELSLEPMTGMKFFPDLFTLNMSYGSVDARRTTFNMRFRLVETVFELLQELKLTSFS